MCIYSAFFFLWLDMGVGDGVGAFFYLLGMFIGGDDTRGERGGERLILSGVICCYLYL